MSVVGSAVSLDATCARLNQLVGFGLGVERRPSVGDIICAVGGSDGQNISSIECVQRFVSLCGHQRQYGENTGLVRSALVSIAASDKAMGVLFWKDRISLRKSLIHANGGGQLSSAIRLAFYVISDVFSLIERAVAKRCHFRAAPTDVLREAVLSAQVARSLEMEQATEENSQWTDSIEQQIDKLVQGRPKAQVQAFLNGVVEHNQKYIRAASEYFKAQVDLKNEKIRKMERAIYEELEKIEQYHQDLLGALREGTSQASDLQYTQKIFAVATESDMDEVQDAVQVVSTQYCGLLREYEEGVREYLNYIRESLDGLDEPAKVVQNLLLEALKRVDLAKTAVGEAIVFLEKIHDVWQRVFSEVQKRLKACLDGADTVFQKQEESSEEALRQTVAVSTRILETAALLCQELGHKPNSKEHAAVGTKRVKEAHDILVDAEGARDEAKQHVENGRKIVADIRKMEQGSLLKLAAVFEQARFEKDGNEVQAELTAADACRDRIMACTEKMRVVEDDIKSS